MMRQATGCVRSRTARCRPTRTRCRCAIATAPGSSSRPIRCWPKMPCDMSASRSLSSSRKRSPRRWMRRSTSMLSTSRLPLWRGRRTRLLPGAPPVWAEHGSNLCIDSEAGDRGATEDAFARAAHVVRLQTTINRVTGVPMELRAARRRLRCGSGAIHRLHQRRRRRDPATGRHRRSARCRKGCGARDLGRCRRQFRDPQQHLSGVCAGRLGGETYRTAGQMGVRSARRVSDRFSRPRPYFGSRTRPRSRTETSSRCVR